MYERMLVVAVGLLLVGGPMRRCVAADSGATTTPVAAGAVMIVSDRTMTDITDAEAATKSQWQKESAVPGGAGRMGFGAR